jgi:hypothetical protein
LSFCRYADDCNIYVGSKRAGERVMQAVTAFLGEVLKLKINASKSAVAHPWERKFLGYSMTWHKQPKLKIAQQSRERLAEKVRKMMREARGKSLKQTIEQLNPFCGDGLPTSGSPKLRVYWKSLMAGSGTGCGPFCGGTGSASTHGQRI